MCQEGAMTHGAVEANGWRWHLLLTSGIDRSNTMAESVEQSATASEQTMNLKALVIGGSGAVGKCLVGELLRSKVIIIIIKS